MSKIKSRNGLRKKRQIRLRKKVLGNDLKPRLSIFKSLKHIYVQLIDDTKGHTLLSVSTASKDYMDAYKDRGTNKTVAKNLAAVFVEKVKEKKIETLRFDRSGYKYHGVIQTFADAIREGGITF